ncbi:hypothetical protein MMC09_001853 [Bachmanniomyces sp. S44760]|nr:hypothetical protein [Bachmanniomyces sp. S44760]
MQTSFCYPKGSNLRNASNYGAPQLPGPPGPPGAQQDQTEEKDSSSEPSRPSDGSWKATFMRMFESAATTFASLTILGLAGYSYHRYYKHLVLSKMEHAFKPGDPVLELAALGHQTPNSILDEGNEHWIPRAEQQKIDGIINGTDKGHYHLMIGEKGTGKSSMLLDAMQKVSGEGVSMFEAHADLEIFRVRLGKALDYEFHEDYIGSLFSIRGPRDTTALLDIERAFNKLEKVALKRRDDVGRPLILIINSTHLLRDDADGQDLLELIQQRAEQWAASNLVTVVLNSDDYWVYERLKQLATRMEVLPISDLPKEQAIGALKHYRSRYFKGEQAPSPQILENIYNKVGGRLTFLNRVAKSKDMVKTCSEICEREKTWLLNKCWILGEEMDDDVMDQQKYCSAAMVLAKALVDQENRDIMIKSPSSSTSSSSSTSPQAITTTPTNSYDISKGHKIPEIPLHKAREIMTRADFIQDYDRINIFTIDSRAMVRADSVPMQNAFREICGQEGFAEFLQATLDRIAAIESLGRTRELVAKDLVGGGRYVIGMGEGKERRRVDVSLVAEDENEK